MGNVSGRKILKPNVVFSLEKIQPSDDNETRAYSVPFDYEPVVQKKDASGSDTTSTKCRTKRSGHHPPLLVKNATGSSNET